VHEQEQTCK
jgi:hypothetical protein